MSRKFDLLGDPIPDNHGEVGANGHIATAEKVNKVRLLLVSGMTQKEIAAQLGITIPTLRKHYFHSGQKKIAAARRQAVADERAKNLLRLDKAAGDGNVAAIKEMKSILADEAMKDRARDAAGDGEHAPAKESKPAATPRGKKEKQVDAAQNAIQQDSLLDPRFLN